MIHHILTDSRFDLFMHEGGLRRNRLLVFWQSVLNWLKVLRISSRSMQIAVCSPSIKFDSLKFGPFIVI